jgi:polar amino acid transport system substrate-binding protein
MKRFPELGLCDRLYKILRIGLVSLMVMIGVISCSAGSPSSLATINSTNLPATVPEQSSHTLDQILQAKQVRVAVPQDFPPFGSLNQTMQPQGYDVDVAQMLADELRVELKLVPVTSDRRISALLSDHVDVVIANLGADPQRALSIYFSKAYAPFYSGMYGTATVNAASYEELKPYTIGVTEDSLEDAELNRKAPPEATIQRYKTNALTIAALLENNVDAIATSNVVAAKLMQENPDKNIGQKFIMKNSPCYIGIPRGDLDFLQWLNVFVTSKKLGGELDALAEKWFGEPLGELPS